MRDELQDLKRCQLRYFTLAITGTSAVIGFSKIFESDNPNGLVLLASLVIVLPCWCTFFDKATTITRLVGFTRILEENLSKIIKGDGSVQYIGHETALALFRKTEDASPSSKTITLSNLITLNQIKVFILRTRHRYWIINWYTYAGISWLCWYLALHSCGGLPSLESIQGIAIYSSLALIIFISFYTLVIVANLTHGKYCYDNVTEYWKDEVFK